MAAEGLPAEHPWSIFYHFFLDDTSYDALLSHSKSLLDASVSISTWKASQYARYIRFAPNILSKESVGIGCYT